MSDLFPLSEWGKIRGKRRDLLKLFTHRGNVRISKSDANEDNFAIHLISNHYATGTICVVPVSELQFAFIRRFHLKLELNILRDN